MKAKNKPPNLNKIKPTKCGNCKEYFDINDLEYNHDHDQMECSECIDGYEIDSLADIGMSQSCFVRMP
jgi:hypothetical protein